MAMTGAIAAPASAGILTASASDCGDETLTQPFAQFGDRANYKLVRNGAFENGTDGWTLAGGAKVVSGNEPWKVGGSDHGKSLVLPAGSTRDLAGLAASGSRSRRCASSPRRTARRCSASRRSPSRSTSRPRSASPSRCRSASCSANGQWKPTPPMLIVANLLPLLPGDRTPVAFQFTPVLGDWQIDDVYVDPAALQVGASSGRAASGCGSAPPASPPRWRSA